MSNAPAERMPHLEGAAGAWIRVPNAAAPAMTDTRLQLHHAAQVANAPAVSYLPPAADDSHTNFTWHPGFGAFVSHRVPFEQPRRFAWRVHDLTLLAIDDRDAEVASFSLAGKTAVQAHAWAQLQCEAAGGDAALYTDAKHYRIPAHAVGDGDAFGADAAALAALGPHWRNAIAVLEAVEADVAGSSSVRLWPHHFDAGLIARIDATRSIGIGFTPGDEWFDEPYWYASPYPAPALGALRPTLAAGAHWHVDRWFSAVFPWRAYAVVAQQGAAVSAYLRSALDANRQLLAARPT